MTVPIWQRAWAGPFALALLGVVLCAWTWQTWPDVLVDFGVQLYVPWRLAAGEVLYRDIAHYTGPLSVYYNALFFRVFGASLRTVEFANLPVLIGIAVGIYYFALRLGGRLCAFICAAAFLTLFAFARPGLIGNYNYICPYEYEYTHGTLLGMGCILFLWRLLRGKSPWNAAAAGFLCGLVFLTRAEFFVATLASSIIGLFLLHRTEPGVSHRVRNAALMFAGSALIAPIASVALLSLAMSLPAALRGTLGMWPAMMGGRVTSLLFYRHAMGIEATAHNLGLLALWAFAYLIALGGLAMWSLRVKRDVPVHAIAAAFASALLMSQPWSQHPLWLRIDYSTLFRPLPLVAAAATLVAVIKAMRSGHDAAKQQRASLLAMLGGASLMLLGKIILAAQIFHYGSLLAMPATILLIGILFGGLPPWIALRGGKPIVFLSGAAVLLGFATAFYVSRTAAVLQLLNAQVGSATDEFRADNRGKYIGRAVDLIDQLVPPEKTVACFPEGIMINYLSRRRTSIPYVNFNPPDLLLFGESSMLDSLKHSPPDYILLVHKDTSEFGLARFGRDYGKEIYAWIVAHYQERPLNVDLGAEPLQGNQFGIRMWAPRTVSN
jgi:hypothetical protein